jgi:hypothetical protein
MLWYCVFMACGFLADSLCAVFSVLSVLVCYSIGAGTGWDTVHLVGPRLKHTCYQDVRNYEHQVSVLIKIVI